MTWRREELSSYTVSLFTVRFCFGFVFNVTGLRYRVQTWRACTSGKCSRRCGKPKWTHRRSGRSAYPLLSWTTVTKAPSPPPPPDPNPTSRAPRRRTASRRIGTGVIPGRLQATTAARWRAESARSSEAMTVPRRPVPRKRMTSRRTRASRRGWFSPGSVAGCSDRTSQTRTMLRRSRERRRRRRRGGRDTTSFWLCPGGWKPGSRVGGGAAWIRYTLGSVVQQALCYNNLGHITSNKVQFVCTLTRSN